MWPDSVAAAPDAGGAYVLAIRLDAPAHFALRGKPLELPAGGYAYAGSAHGPGGIRARLSRHFRRDKKLHWHVDRLTTVAAEISAMALPDGCECALVARLLETGRFHPAGAGLGSSDCRTCPAHLLAWSGG